MRRAHVKLETRYITDELPPGFNKIRDECLQLTVKRTNGEIDHDWIFPYNGFVKVDEEHREVNILLGKLQTKLLREVDLRDFFKYNPQFRETFAMPPSDFASDDRLRNELLQDFFQQTEQVDCVRHTSPRVSAIHAEDICVDEVLAP